MAEETKSGKPTEQTVLARHGYRGPRFFWGLIGLLVLVVILFALSFGWHWRHMAYGPVASREFGYENHMGFRFRGPHGMMMYGGIAGAVKQVSGSQVTVTAANGIDEIVQVDAQTQIIKSGAAAKITDLKSGDSVTVSGFPNGVNEIQARAITVQ